jgi:ectoine hydroxylase
MKLDTDAYPTRIAGTPRIFERRDPVVHAEGAARTEGPLAAEQVGQFERDGYLAFDHVFSPEEVQAWYDELHRLRDTEAASDRPEVINEPESGEVRSIFAVHRSNAIFERLARDRRLVETVRQLLGDEVYVNQSRINFKPGFTGKEFDWHSDFETWHAEDGMPRMRAISVNIALTDNTPHNGPLMLIPGSHKWFVPCIGKQPEAHYQSSLTRQTYGVPDRDSLTWLYAQGGLAAPTGGPGSIVMFECNTMHGSNSNITPLPRTNAFLVYNAVSNALTEPFAADHRRPAFLAERDATPVTPL